MTTFESNSSNKSLSSYLSNLQDDVRRVLFAQHFGALKDYARRVMADGEILTETEERDRNFRMEELRIIGKTFNISEKQLVAELYKGLFASELK